MTSSSSSSSLMSSSSSSSSMLSTSLFASSLSRYLFSLSWLRSSSIRSIVLEETDNFFDLDLVILEEIDILGFWIGWNLIFGVDCDVIFVSSSEDESSESPSKGKVKTCFVPLFCFLCTAAIEVLLLFLIRSFDAAIILSISEVSGGGGLLGWTSELVGAGVSGGGELILAWELVGAGFSGGGALLGWTLELVEVRVKGENYLQGEEIW